MNNIASGNLSEKTMAFYELNRFGA